MRFFRQALIGLTLLTLSLGILSYAGYLIKDALSERFAQEARVPQPRERTFAVNVVTAEPKSITPQLEAFGEIGWGQVIVKKLEQSRVFQLNYSTKKYLNF